MILLSEDYYFVLVLLALIYMGLLFFFLSRWLQWIEKNEKGKRIEKLIFFFGVLLEVVGLIGITYYFYWVAD